MEITEARIALVETPEFAKEFSDFIIHQCLSEIPATRVRARAYAPLCSMAQALTGANPSDMVALLDFTKANQEYLGEMVNKCCQSIGDLAIIAHSLALIKDNPITFKEICEASPCVNTLYGWACVFHIMRNDKPDPNYCKRQSWKALPQKNGRVGMQYLLRQLVGLTATNRMANFEFKNQESEDVCTEAFLSGMALCNHAPDKIIKYNGMEICESQCRCEFPPDPTNKGDRNAGRGFVPVISALMHAGGVEEAPEPINVQVPISEIEPVFIVRSFDDAYRLWNDLKYKERLEAGEISRWYARESIYVCDKDSRKVLLSSKLTKEAITGSLSFLPVVMTFRDEELERKLATVCVQVVVIEPKPVKNIEGEDVLGEITLEDVRRAVKQIAAEVMVGIQDMPKEVLDGRLGEICRTRMADFPRAYAWLSLLAAASVLVPKLAGRLRTNLYVALVGDKGTGKSAAMDCAFYLLDLQQPPLLPLKAGSAERMAKRIGDAGGEPRLVAVDELAHLLVKANIENASFTQVLSTAYYHDLQDMPDAQGKQANFNCRLTIAGGVVEEKFQELFGAKTTDGFYDRFIFGQHPTGFSYDFVPFDEGPRAYPRPELESGEASGPVVVEVEDEVYTERKRWRVEFGIPSRVSEHAIRAAVICASFDGRAVLRVADLGPALAFARYQVAIRKILAPNPGKNPEAIIAYKVVDYLRLHAPEGQWVNRRKMLQAINGYDYGPTVVDRALRSLELNGEIEQGQAGRQKIVRLNLDRL